MASRYFEKFPKFTFDAYGVVDIASFLPEFPVKSKTTSFSITLTDIFIKTKILDKILDDATTYYPYIWKNQDRPDTVAKKYYGDEKYFWLVFFSNGAFDLKMDFPMAPEVFKKYLVEKYREDDVVREHVSDNNPSMLTFLEQPNEIQIVLNTVPHHKEIVATGYVVDDDYVASPTVTYSYLDVEERDNEKNRTIKLISREHASAIDYELRKKLSEI